MMRHRHIYYDSLEQLELELELHLLEHENLTLDAGFKEEEHPRDKGGQFEDKPKTSATETENESQKRKYEKKDTIVSEVVNSDRFRDACKSLVDDPKIGRRIHANILTILDACSGTEREGLSFINCATNKTLTIKKGNYDKRVRMGKGMKKLLRVSKPHMIIGIHNHPNSTAPSIEDIIAMHRRQYKFGVVACHNGTLFKYSENNGEDLTRNLFKIDLALDILQKNLYIKKEIEDQLQTLKECGLNLEVIKLE